MPSMPTSTSFTRSGSTPAKPDAVATVKPDPAELRRAELGELLPEDRKIPGLAVGDARLDLTARTEQVEQAIRGGDLREDVELVDVTVHAAPLGAQTALHEQLLVEQPNLLLPIESEGALLRQMSAPMVLVPWPTLRWPGMRFVVSMRLAGSWRSSYCRPADVLSDQLPPW